jgi:predicted AAA+ superfamily ATPase
VVLDEIHRSPDLFPTLRVLADRRPTRAHFLVLGSASPDLLRQSSESLAGRISYLPIEGFGLDEVGPESLRRLWLRGAFPRAFLAASDADSLEWRQDFVATFLERDLPGLGIGISSAALRRFWIMLAHWHGQIWNAAELARSFGVSDASVRRYLDALASTFVVRVVQPWFANIAKRQVKSPRIYVADSGLLHALLGIESWDDLQQHPKLGASWEGFAANALTRHLGAGPEEWHFWRTHAGAELDVLVVRGRQRRGFEIKHTVAPAVTPSMAIAIEELGLRSLDVVHSGDETYPLRKNIRAVAAKRILEDIEPLH